MVFRPRADLKLEEVLTTDTQAHLYTTYMHAAMPSTTLFPLSYQSVSTMSKGRPTTATATTNSRGRSNSFVSTLKRLIPSNRAERGGTARQRGYHDTFVDVLIPTSRYTPPTSQNSRHQLPEKLVRRNTAVSISTMTPPSNSTSSPSTQSQILYLERREKRRQRRSLKESGDYLGVQGINPSTGEMDVLTPSSSSVGGSSQQQQEQLHSLARAVQDKRSAYEQARRALRAEKVRKWEMDKAALRAERRRKVRWTRGGSVWSSALEPDLSPIEGSSAASSPRQGEASTETVVRSAGTRENESGKSGGYSGPSESYYTAYSDSEGGTVSTVRLATTSRNSSADHAIRRKSVPSPDRLPGSYPPSMTDCRTSTSQENCSGLIPVGSDSPPERLPKVGPSPVG